MGTAVKISVLLFIVVFLYLRKAKSQSRLTDLLRKVAFFGVFVCALWWLAKAYGPAQYIVYSDSFGAFSYRDAPVLVAWEQNTLLPIAALSEPVLISGDYGSVYPLSGQHLDLVKAKFPYSHDGSIIDYLFALGIALYLLVLLSRSREIESRWNLARTQDSIPAYDDFMAWSGSNLIRKMHSLKLRRKAKGAIEGIEQRSRLKLEVFKEGWKNRGVESPFLNILKLSLEKGHREIKLEVAHVDSREQAIPASELPTGALRDVVSRFDAVYSFLVGSYKAVAENTPHFKFTGEYMALHSSSQTRFCPPAVEYCESSLKKHLRKSLVHGVDRFVGNDLITVSEGGGAGGAVLKVTFNPYLESINRLNNVNRVSVSGRAARFDGGAGYKDIVVDGVEYEGAPVSSFTLGMTFAYEFLIDGKMMASGSMACLPDPGLVHKAYPGREYVKAAAEQNIFDMVALSTSSAFLARLIGIDKQRVDQHLLSIDAETLGRINSQNERCADFVNKLEEALRTEARDQLTIESATALYEKNKDQVDAVILEYMTNVDDAETVKLALDLLGEMVPGFAESLIDVVAEASGEL